MPQLPPPVGGPAAEPSLKQALSQVVQFWSIVSDNLKILSHSLLRNLPLTLNLESSILAFLIWSADTHKCLSSFHLSGSTASQRSFFSPGIYNICEDIIIE